VRLRLALQIITVALASSYVTLGIFDADRARELWMPYGVVMLGLVVTDLVVDRRER
jgi:hypothetical protein